MNKEHIERGISTRQKILNLIVQYIQDNGFPPTIREISDISGLKSTSTVYTHLHRLQDEGFIEMCDYQPRTIRVIGYKFVKE